MRERGKTKKNRRQFGKFCYKGSKVNAITIKTDIINKPVFFILNQNLVVQILVTQFYRKIIFHRK